MSIKEKTAIVLLAYADYESLELTLAAYASFIKNDEKLFILQNGRGTYDCERTYRVAKRYASLYPRNIEVVDDIPQGYPYYSIKTLLASERMKKYDYICKVDDDCFPLTRTWFDDLCTCYEDSAKTYGDSLGYVTSLVNNNPWGFDKILDIFEKREEFFNVYAREHKAGGKGYGTERIYGKNEIHAGCCGTVWGNAYISRWVHRFSTMAPEEYVKRTTDLGYAEVDNTKRYSINCMLFRKEFWNAIDMDSHDDEHQCFMYCKEHGKKNHRQHEHPYGPPDVLHPARREQNPHP